MCLQQHHKDEFLLEVDLLQDLHQLQASDNEVVVLVVDLTGDLIVHHEVDDLLVDSAEVDHQEDLA